MYSLDVNFLKDRSPQPGNSGSRTPRPTLPAGDMTPVYIGVAIGVFFPVLLGTGWWFLQAKNAELEQTVATLEQENQRLEAEIGNINKIRDETNKVKSETQSLVAVFDQIRPWSAMLQDMRDRIPATVQIESVEQIAPTASTTDTQAQTPPNPAGGVKFIGFARSFNDVNDFLITLQQSRFLKSTETKITTAELQDAPVPPGSTPSGVIIKPPQVVKYTIESAMSDVPASELMRELQQKGTIGLVARIRSLQQTGVIKK
jgi:type IV pilus assembly protein PilN